MQKSNSELAATEEQLDDMATDGLLWYLASPYSKCSRGIEQAFRDACLQAGWLIRRGIKVYSPIAHTHPIAVISGMNPLDHSIWMPLDEPMMKACVGLIVSMMPGWRESVGIEYEIAHFTQANKPIRYI